MRRATAGGIATLGLLTVLAGCTPPRQEPEVRVGSRTVNYERAIITLQVHARDASAPMRANCVEALEPAEDRRAAEVIEQGLHDDAWVVRFAAAMASGKRRSAKLQPVLQALATRDNNESVKVASVYALYRLGDYSQMNLLLQALKSPDNSVRSNTYLVLGAMGDANLIKLLKTRIRESDPRAKFELTAALARLGDEDAQRIIASLIISKVAEDQWNALGIAGDLPEERVVNSLLVAVREPLSMVGHPRELEIRRQLLAARALGRMGKITGGKIALQYAKDPSPDLRALAALALGELLLPNEERAVARLLDDPEPRVRVAAAAAIINIWSKMERTATTQKTELRIGG